MEKALYLLFLSVCSWQDLQQKKISVRLLALVVSAGAAVSFLRMGKGDFSPADLGPGLFLFLAAFLTRGAVGKGDAWILVAAGLFLGWAEATAELFLGLALAAVWGSVGIVRGKKNGRSRLPFLPFLWLACVFLLLSGKMTAAGGR